MAKHVGFGTRYFGLPTPKFYRILGDSISASFGTISIGSMITALPNVDDPHTVKLCIWVGLVCSIITVIGKLIFNFFGQIEKETINY
jgi:hypothetical protein